MLKQTDAEIIIDRKDFSGDKFDDLKVKTPNGTTEFQIKYSDDEYSHKLAKDDFANGNGHDTALCDLFASWKTRKESENDTQIKLCLAWNRPDDDDPIVEFLKPIQEQALPFSIVAYSFDGEVFWPVGNLPPKTWRKFNLAVKSGLIDREAFLSFCNELTIILEMPKASLDLKNPGGIENVIIRQAEKLGVGIYPNDNLNLEEVIYKLATEVKRSRAMGNRLYINTLMGRLGFIRDYGKFDQRFPVDSAHKVMLDDEIESLHRAIRDSKRVIITGNPGSGKSWLVDEYIDKLENDDSKVIHYNCFQSLQDTNSLERIRVTSLYGNLVSQIVEQYPELVEHKNTTLGADKAELENLLRLIGGEFYLVVDGLDHISREYDLHKDLISRSETEIISELLEIHFPDNCYVTIASQPIDALDEFKANSYCIFKIEPWGIKQVKSLMATFQIADDTIKGDDSSISEYLLKKSQGNALYLNYILRQLRNSNVNKELIDGIPDYDISLSEYYSYLYKKIHNNRTVNALCGADFYLSLNDLMEITGDGEFVEQDISMLHPLLAENVLSGGFSIYHESFRRFVLSSLENRKVDIEKNVYGILTDWLQEKPFFKFDKSFYYLSELLYKIKKDAENIALIDKKFVLNAVAEGYSRKRIRMNLNCIIRSAASSDVGRNTFYSELPEVIISHSGRITKGLLDALFAFEYDKDIIVEIWRNVFDIMKLRFPNLDQYTSDNIFEETDELLELRNCLLMRFIDGGKESFLATYAYLANAAEKEKFSEFTESIVFCLEHYEQYNLVTQIAIADLVRCYGWCLKDMNIDRMISAINVVYPTGNLLLDVIFSEFTVYNSYLLMCSDKHAPDYMEQEDVEFYLAEQLYDLGKEEVQEGTDEYAENSVYRDPIMQVLDTSGINYIEIYKKLHASRRLNDKMQDFVGGASKILETNTVYKSYVIQYALHAIIEKAFIDREPELLPQTLFRLIPDYQGMYKLFKCRDMQPQNHLYDKNNSCEPFLINNKDEYILIGCSEIKKHIDYHQTSLIFAYQGIVGEAGDEHQIPFQQYLATAVEEGEIYTILDNPESLIDFIRTLDRELEDEDYLWPGTSVSKLLDVHIEFDFLNGRYIAINQEKDVVFIMKKWSSSYKGDSEYHGNAIPLYSGTKLYIKKEYIGILEQQFGTLMMKTCVQSYTQDY